MEIKIQTSAWGVVHISANGVWLEYDFNVMHIDPSSNTGNVMGVLQELYDRGIMEAQQAYLHNRDPSLKYHIGMAAGRLLRDLKIHATLKDIQA